jgi:hypothetical protein
MAERQFAFSGQQILTVTWPLNLTQIQVRLEEKTIGVIPNRAELKKGARFLLEDGNGILIKEESGWGMINICAFYQDLPLTPVMKSPWMDPAKLAYILSALSLAVALFAFSSEALQERLNPAFTALTAGIFLGLGFLVSRRIFGALLCLILLYSFDAGILIGEQISSSRNVSGIFWRGLVLLWMYRGLPEKKKIFGLILAVLGGIAGNLLWQNMASSFKEATTQAPRQQEPQLSTVHSFEVPLVLQKANVDCGVATLQAMLNGYEIPTDYEKLRIQLKTDETGTNIDDMEEAALEYGLAVEQTVVPPEMIFLPEAQMLPSIVVVVNEQGNNRMLLLWDREGEKIKALNPEEVGRVSLTPEELTRQLLIHEQDVPAEAYKNWACASIFSDTLRIRMQVVGLSSLQASLLQKQACARTDWRPIALLDAKTRKLSTQKNVPKEEAFSVLSDSSDTPDLDEFRFATQAPVDNEGSPQVTLRGAVLLVSYGKNVVEK